MVRAGPTGDLLEQLNSNDLDTVLTLDKKLCRPELTTLAQQEEEIIFVTLSDSSHERDALISLETLCAKPFILTEHQASYRYELERHLSERELSIRPILEIGNTETIINLLKKGMGISFLPRFTVEQQLQEGTLMELSTDLPRVCMYHQLLCHKGKWITPQLKVFLELVQKYLSRK